MDLHLCMQHFVTVVRHKSFTRAARHLRMNKPTLSKHIQWLEDEHLKTQLIERTTRKLILTTAGETYYQHAQKILADIEDSKRSVLETSHELQGVINIAAPIVVYNTVLLSPLTKFLDQHPKVKFHFLDENYPSFVLDGSADILVSASDINEAQLVKIPLFTTHRRLFAAPGYLKKYGVPKNPQDLQHHRCLINKMLPSPCTWIFESGESVQITGPLSSRNGAALMSAAVAGMGILWTHEYVVAEEVKKGTLMQIPCVAPSPDAKLYLYHLPAVPSNRIRILANYLSEFIPRTFDKSKKT